jgi:hypothetical protein
MHRFRPMRSLRAAVHSSLYNFNLERYLYRRCVFRRRISETCGFVMGIAPADVVRKTTGVGSIAHSTAYCREKVQHELR